MAGHAVEGVEIFKTLLHQLLEKARITKSATTIEPPLSKSDFTELLGRISLLEYGTSPQESKRTSQYAVIETAIRDIFNELLASSNIDQPEFVHLWNLLDIVSILSDDGECDPALLFWLVEELLDSQTIAGCRKIFDYLESRRERITAKHFDKKNLVILRSCNELLRRLSRAEDTAFCGRVFIFLFQSFPLGDKSSVNLRGEYHVENVTTFDDLPQKKEDGTELMEVDTEVKSTPTGPAADTKVAHSGTGPNRSNEDLKTMQKSVSFDQAQKPTPEAEKPLDPDTLYPIFWSLQQSFSQPKRLFSPEYFKSFKNGLDATILMFKSVQNESTGRGPSKPVSEGKRGIKRKRGQGDDDLANVFNPKYLTSRDLFELEISDLSFRRHILVQALIIMDFLLSLSPKAKEKLATVTTQNKSVMYQEQVMAEDDIKWATETKKTIADYLKQGHEGPFFYRMVETVLTRDKNWVRWKIENCPPIERRSISAEDYLSSKGAARRVTTNKRLRPKAMGSLELDFLNDNDSLGNMEKLKDPAKYRIPSLESFRDKIMVEDLDIEMNGADLEAKEAAIYRKASKSWRVLRIASKSKLISFDKIDDPDKIDVIFQDESQLTKENDLDIADISGISLPDDKRVVVISGLIQSGRDALVKKLIETHPSTFSKAASHTTRSRRDDEIDGEHYSFITSENFRIMRDGDQLMAFSNSGDDDYGLSRKSIESVVATGKVPVVELEFDGIQQFKDNGYSARFILIAPSSLDDLEKQLRSQGIDDEKIQEHLRIAKEDITNAEIDGFYDKVITNADVEKSFTELEQYIFGKGEDAVADSNEVDNNRNEIEDDVTEMVDVPMTDDTNATPEAGENAAIEGNVGE